ncbi:MAG: 3-coathanger stack domain-containing protein, partial [Bacteroidia bacterium]
MKSVATLIKTSVLTLSLYAMCVTPVAAQTAKPSEVEYETNEPKCGQEHFTPQQEEEYKQSVLRSNKRSSANKVPSGIYYFPVQFHLLKKSNGTGGITEQNAIDELKAANTKYAPAGIQFYQCGPPRIIKSDSLYNIKMNINWVDTCGATTPEYNLCNANNIDSVINIYYVTVSSGWNWSHFPSWRFSQCKDWLIMNRNGIGSQWLLAHELGHYFNLAHTFSTRTDNNGNPILENITRDNTNSCYNCDTDGDYICDTPADPNLWDKPTCTYNGTGNDGCGNPAYVPDPQNIMCYANGCQNYFTQGQIDRMRDAAQNDRNYLHCDKLSDCIADWNLTGTSTSNYSWQASNSIVSNAQLSNNALLAYDAANFVKLSVGFEAKSGVNFTAMLNGCYGDRIFYRTPTYNNYSDAGNIETVEVLPNPTSS